MLFCHDKGNALDVGLNTDTHRFANFILNIAEKLLTKPDLSLCLFDWKHDLILYSMEF
jgi:hypothetical protein